MKEGMDWAGERERERACSICSHRFFDITLFLAACLKENEILLNSLRSSFTFRLLVYGIVPTIYLY